MEFLNVQKYGVVADEEALIHLESLLTYQIQQTVDTQEKRNKLREQYTVGYTNYNDRKYDGVQVQYIPAFVKKRIPTIISAINNVCELIEAKTKSTTGHCVFKHESVVDSDACGKDSTCMLKSTEPVYEIGAKPSSLFDGVLGRVSYRMGIDITGYQSNWYLAGVDFRHEIKNPIENVDEIWAFARRTMYSMANFAVRSFPTLIHNDYQNAVMTRRNIRVPLNNMSFLDACGVLISFDILIACTIGRPDLRECLPAVFSGIQVMSGICFAYDEDRRCFCVEGVFN